MAKGFMGLFFVFGFGVLSRIFLVALKNILNYNRYVTAFGTQRKEDKNGDFSAQREKKDNQKRRRN